MVPGGDVAVSVTGGGVGWSGAGVSLDGVGVSYSCAVVCSGTSATTSDVGVISVSTV